MSDEARRTPEVEAAGGWRELRAAVFGIWLRPRQTIRRIVTANPRYGVVLLVALSGSSATVMAWPGDRARSFGLTALLFLACTMGPLAGLAVLWIGAWIVRGLGRALMGGRAAPEEMRAALAWANVPLVAALPVAVLLTVLEPPTGSADPSPALGVLMTLLGLALVVLGIWALVIACHTVAEVQGYSSARKGLWNLLPSIGIVVAIGVLAAIPILLAARR